MVVELWLSDHFSSGRAADLNREVDSLLTDLLVFVLKRKFIHCLLQLLAEVFGELGLLLKVFGGRQGLEYLGQLANGLIVLWKWSIITPIFPFLTIHSG